MSWLDIFGGDKVIDAGISVIDKIVYTEEEKADSAIVKTRLKIKLLEAYSAFKVTQRYLAVIFGVPYAISWQAAFIASFFVDVDKQILILNGTMGTIVLGIVGFYFFGGVAESVGRAIKK